MTRFKAAVACAMTYGVAGAMSLAASLAGCASAAPAGGDARTGAALAPPGSICTPACSVDFVSTAFAPPHHGLMIAHGSFFTQQGGWTVVDYDASTLSRIQTQLVNVTNGTDGTGGKPQLRLAKRSAIALNKTELARIRKAADQIWASATPVPGSALTDIVWDIYLVDIPTIRRESGTGNPGGIGNALENLLNTTWDRSRSAAVEQ